MQRQQIWHRHTWLGDILAVLLGIGMVLGFAPFAWRLLLLVSLTGWILLLELTPAKRAAWRGLLFGLGWFTPGVSWVYNSLYDFGNAPVLVAASIAFALVLANAAFMALLAWLYRRYPGDRLPGSARLLLLPVLWVILEWVRSILFTGFPWLLLGYSQVDTLLAGYIPIGGVLLASLLLVCSCSIIAAACLAVTWRKRLQILLLLSLLYGLGWALGHIQWVQPSGKQLQVSLVQGNIPQALKLERQQLYTNLQQYVELSRPQFGGSDLIVWPETAIPVFWHQVEDFLAPLIPQLADSGTELVTGIFGYDAASGVYYNSLQRLGDKQVLYNKQHLVPFGEYMPLRGLLKWLNRYIQIPFSDISAGDKAEAVTIAGVPFGFSICYESAYADIYRQQLPAAELLINVSNDAWFGDSFAPHQHLEIARSRALESGRYILRATNNGISAIITETGAIQTRTAQFATAVLTDTVRLYRGRTPFVRWGNLPVILLAMILSIVSLIIYLRSRP